MQHMGQRLNEPAENPSSPQHNHVTRDIKPLGTDCPACAAYWAAHAGTVVKCVEPGCETVRTDEPDYSAIQPISGLPLGWYSGDDGEFCPKHIATLMAGINRIQYRYYLPGGEIEETA